MEETLNSSDPQPSDDPMDEAEPLPSLSKSQNPTPTSDTDSDSDDSDSGDEAQQTFQIETLETELSNNPVNYDSHVQYIRALRKKGDIEKLRKAREAMSELFPLSPAMWQEWAKDETSLSSGPESFPAIEKLYERGVYDYLSVFLWCDYLNFVQEHDPSVRECSAVGILKARNLFERALPGAGLHVAEGHKIWEAYREFEQAIFFAIDETDVEGREKQVQRIRSIFHRQLSVPHSDLRPTLLAYKAWEAEQGNVLDASSSDLDGISAHVASAYQKALEMLNARVHFEEQISKKDIPDMERLQEYMAYLKFEQSFGDPARVQILYERAVTEFPISNDLWLDYTRYLDKTLKASSIVREAYSRATKNCPWIGELWVRYLLCLERGRAPEMEIATLVADGEALMNLSRTLLTSVKSHIGGGVTPSDFISCLLRDFTKVQGRKGTSDFEAAHKNSILWKEIGFVVSPIFKNFRGCCTMLGPMQTEVKQQNVAVYRKRAKQTESSQPQQLGNTGAEEKRTDTDENMLTMFDILKSKRRVKLESLILNRKSFAQTVENLFALSFWSKMGGL